MTTQHDFRVLSMDGGDGRVTAQLLQEIAQRLEQKYPGTGGNFLNSVTLFAGSSAGGINSLLLAQQSDADGFLKNELLPLWMQLELAMLPLPPRPQAPSPDNAVAAFGPLAPFAYPIQVLQYLAQLGLALAGLHNVVNNDAIKALLTGQFGQKKLGDLHKTVAITAFQLDNEAVENRRWVPRVFTNVPRSIDPDNNDVDELSIDVALRTSAQPVYFPIYQAQSGKGSGFIDGGYVANSAGMVAIARAYALINKLSHHPVQANALLADEAENGASLAEATINVPSPSAAALATVPPSGKVLMLSLGAGTANSFPGPDYVGPDRLKFVGGSATWGYLLWLLNPTQPFLLLNVVLSAQMEEVDFQLRNILQPIDDVPSYCRFAPRLQNSRAVPAQELRSFVRAAMQQDELDRVVDWLVASGWVSVDDRAQTPPTPPAAAAVVPVLASDDAAPPTDIPVGDPHAGQKVDEA